MERHALGKTNALNLTAAMLIDHVRSRRAEGAGAATVANDLIWIGVVLRAARIVKELPVLPKVVQLARNACRELRLIGKARKRARRPTNDGYQIHEVAQFTLHESWNELKRYTNLRPENMREIPPAITGPPILHPLIHTAGRSARRGRRHSLQRASSVRHA